MNLNEYQLDVTDTLSHHALRPVLDGRFVEELVQGMKQTLIESLKVTVLRMKTAYLAEGDEQEIRRLVRRERQVYGAIALLASECQPSGQQVERGRSEALALASLIAKVSEVFVAVVFREDGELQDHLADMLTSMTLLARTGGLSLQDVLEKSRQRLSQSYPDGPLYSERTLAQPRADARRDAFGDSLC